MGMLFFNQIWSHNLEFQFGFILNCVKQNIVAKLLSPGPAGCSSNLELSQQVTQMESLKCQPDDQLHPEVHNWKYQKLYQLLLDLSSHPNLYPLVIETFKWPIQFCPDLVALGILGANGSSITTRCEILSLTIPSFLSNNPNAAVILHLLWSMGETSSTPSPNGSVDHQWAKKVLVQSMGDYYLKSPPEEQQQRLSRILDVAQDLKALSLLLNSNVYPFVIDLACLASRREYLKLDKWLMDKLQLQNGPEFVIQAVSFLNRRCPALLGGMKSLDPGAPLILNLPSETLATVLACLNNFVMNNQNALMPDVKEKILTMVSNSQPLLQNVPRQIPTGGRSTSQTLADLGLGSLSISSSLNTQSQVISQQQMATQRMPFGSVQPPSVGTPSIPGVQNPAAAGSQQRLNAVFGDLASIFPEMQQNVSPEIEKEADTYFQRIYNQSSSGSMTIDDVLEMLRRFQDSSNQREKEVFTCMIRNLFKEYCYFPQYPEKELLITAQLFGGIIQMGLVKYMALVVALRYVLEALRKPCGSKMYVFGITALERFKSKLKDYPLYCQHLASIAHFDQFPAPLREYIQYGSQSTEPPTPPARVPLTPIPQNITPAPVPQPAVVPTSSIKPHAKPPHPPSVVMADIKTLDLAVTPITAPSENVQDRIAFIINNLSQINLIQKTEEFKEAVGKEKVYHPWIAQYFVTKRASIELNFHSLYSNFLETLKTPEVTDLIIKETYRNIKVLLASDKEIDNFSDRSLLKNLGHWLGMLTLAKCKPVLAIDLNIKYLLIEAYHKGTQELLYVVPFIAKVLESCGKSRVFKPPNPWTMGILKALVELHQEPSLKLNLKFEVEVLCKTLSVDVQKLIGLSTTLQREDLKERVMREPQLGRPKAPVAPTLPTVGREEKTWTKPGDNLGVAAPFPTVLKQHEDEKPQMPSPPPVGTVIPSPGVHVYAYHEIPTNIAGLTQHIVIPGNLAIFQQTPALKQIVRMAIERAITEWVTPVVERSMKISIITAEQIIKKDFALESDEHKMHTAAHYLIRNLTAGMAMITSKETLYMSIVNNLLSAFSQLARSSPGLSTKDLNDSAQAIASENIDLSCCFIEKLAVEKAKIELDKRLTPEYESRKRARAEGRRFCDPATLTYQAERMPEAIRLKVGSVPPQHFQVYEDIGRNIPGFAPVVSQEPSMTGLTPAAVAAFQQQQQLKQTAGVASNFPQANFEPPAASSVDTGLVNLYDKLVAELEQLLTSFAQNGLPAVLINTMHSILEAVVLARSNPRDIVGALNLIQKVLDAIGELLQSVESPMIDLTLISRARDLYLVILKALADPRAYGHQWTTKQITRLVLERILQQTQSAPLPDELFDVLMRSMLINLPLLDHNLAQYTESAQSPVAITFSIQFLKIYGPQGLHETEVQNIISALIKLSKNSGEKRLADEVSKILEGFRPPAVASENMAGAPGVNMGPVRPQAEDFDGSEADFMEKTERLLREWIAMFHSSADLNKVFTVYVQQMNLQGILKTDESITRFFRLSTELCVEFCYRILSVSQNQPQTQQHVVETRNKCFHTLDAFAHLIIMLVKHSGNNTAVPSSATAKIELLSKVLGIISTVALQDQENRKENFQHLPYYRILIMLFMELTLGPNNLGLPIPMQLGFGNPQLDPVYETIQFQVLTAFCHTLRILKPSKAPSFAYAWLDFISHRTFVDKCLNGAANSTSSPKGWVLYAGLLMELIKFLSPFLRSVELAGPVDLLYKVCIR